MASPSISFITHHHHHHRRPPMAPPLPPVLQNSHEDGSHAALRILLLSFCMWEMLYRASGLLIERLLIRYPHRLLDSSLSSSASSAAANNNASTNGKKREGEYDNNQCTNNGSHTNDNNNIGDIDNINDATNPKYETARHTLLHRGPSYLVSFLHSIYATSRGCMHLYELWNASHIDKLLIPDSSIVTSITIPNYYRAAHLHVAQTNLLFLAYLLYDLCHVLHQYPKLGGLDTILHHILFASCSFINGTFGVMAFCFGWLVVGEGSTIFLNIRWYLLKSGRDKGVWIDRINGLFALTFFITRIGIYSAGMIHVLYYSWEEVLSLPKVCGVPWSMLGLTCGCMILGWVLNFVWGYKILSMVVVGGGGDRSEKKRKNE